MNEHISKYIASGLSIIPIGSEKKPLIEWKRYQSEIAVEEIFELWNLPIACICGKISGGLVAIDFDDRGSCFKLWGDTVKEYNPELLKKLTYQRTPSGGWHVLYKTSKIIPNSKLANRPARPGELDKNGKLAKIIGLIENRGEGGYFLIAPSAGYILKSGDLLNIKTISEEESDLLQSISISFDQMPKEFITPREISQPINRIGLSPYDDYDNKNDPIFLLQSHGWKIICQKNNETLFCRPGKDRGISATWNHIPGRFFVFSTSTEFETGTIYKPSAVYAILEHNKDWPAAAKALYRDGYGSRVEKKEMIDYDLAPATQLVKMGDYKEEIYKYYNSPREAGCFLGLELFDKLLRFDRGYLNVFSGIPTHGKSEFLDFIIMLLSKMHNWNFVIFSPENYPLQIHFNKLAEKFHDQNMYSANRIVIDEAREYLDEHFEFIDATEDELSLETILSTTLSATKKHRVDCLIIDPWNEIELSRPPGISETDFIGVCLRKLRKFARKNNICIIIVAHPTKMARMKDNKGTATNKYMVPSLYDISNSSNWYNKTDNGLVVYRDFDKDVVEIHVKKVKFKNYGMIGQVNFNYDVLTGKYTELSEIEQPANAQQSEPIQPIQPIQQHLYLGNENNN